MEKKYRIAIDVTSDLFEDVIEKHDIIVIPMPYEFDGKNYIHYLDSRECSHKEFYDGLRKGKSANTSQINPNTFVENFEPILKQGQDILYFGFSSGLSGTLQSAHIAKQTLKERYPNREIVIVDTLGATLGQAALIVPSLELYEQGAPIHQVAEFAENLRLHVCHWFVVDDLHFLHRGGRLRLAAAIAGTLIRMKPVLHVDNEGKLALVEKKRGTNTAYRTMIEKMKQTGKDLSKQTVYISHGDHLEGAELLAKWIQEEDLVKEVKITTLCPVIASHSGPGTLALFFIGDER